MMPTDNADFLSLALVLAMAVSNIGLAGVFGGGA
jgi:hypothetical protein